MAHLIGGILFYNKKYDGKGFMREAEANKLGNDILNSLEITTTEVELLIEEYDTFAKEYNYFRAIKSNPYIEPYKLLAAFADHAYALWQIQVCGLLNKMPFKKDLDLYLAKWQEVEQGKINDVLYRFTIRD